MKKVLHYTRKLSKLLLKTFLSLIAVALILIVTLLILLRTDFMNQVTANFLINEAQKQGINIEFSTFKGPLPTHISIDDLKVSDAQGLLFSAQNLELEFSPLKLLMWQIEIPVLHLHNAELVRIPVFANAKVEEVTVKSNEQFLPLKLNLNSVKINQALIRHSFFEDLAQTKLEKQDLTSTLIADGTAHISGKQFSINFSSSLVHKNGSGFYFMAQSKARDSSIKQSISHVLAEDLFELQLFAFEEENGILASLSKQDLPAYSFSFSGSGSLSDWRANSVLKFGTANLNSLNEEPSSAVHQFIVAQSELYALTSNFNFNLVSPKLNLIDLKQTDWNIYVDLQAASGKTAQGQLKDLLSKNLLLQIKAKHIDNKLDFFDGVLQVAGLELSFEQIDINQNADQLDITGDLELKFEDNHALERALFGAANNSFWTKALKGSTLSNNFTLLLEPKQSSLKLEGALDSLLSDKELALAYRVNSNYNGSILQIAEAEVSGHGINSKISGSFKPENLDAQAMLLAGITNNSAWQNNLWDQLKIDKADMPSGDVNLQLNLLSLEQKTFPKQKTNSQFYRLH